VSVVFESYAYNYRTEDSYHSNHIKDISDLQLFCVIVFVEQRSESPTGTDQNSAAPISQEARRLSLRQRAHGGRSWRKSFEKC